MTSDDGGSAAVPACAAILRSVRAGLGLTQREMAERLGISARSLILYESGEREPAHPVLERYAALMPLEAVAGLLGHADRCAAWAWPEAWEAHRDAMGYVVDEAAIDVHLDGTGRVRETLLLAGVRILDPALASQRQLTSMMRVACMASPRRLRQLIAPDDDTTEVRFAEGEHEHVIALRKDLPCGLDYRREGALGPGPVPLQVHHDVAHPLSRLRLRLALGGPPPEGMEPRVVAWPSASGDASNRDVASALVPDAEIVSESPGTVEARISRPPVGFRWGLAWVPEGSPKSLGSPRGRHLGARLENLREDLGISLRDMAERLGCGSHVTVRNAEQGSDVTRETLRAVLEAFPQLSVHHLLPPRVAPHDIDLDALWLHARDAFGFCMDGIDKRGRIDDEGRMAMTLRMSHLRLLRSPFDDFEFRHGGILGVFQAAPHAIQEIKAAASQVIVRGRVDADGTSHQVFRFQRHPEGRAMSLTMRHAAGTAVQYYLTGQRAGGVRGPGTYHEGTSHWVRFPCERLRISLDLPRGYEPRAVLGHVCPWRIAPDVDLPSLSHRVPVPVPSLRERNGILTVAITVRRPLVGFKYGLAWELPP